jgi:hypothetical protein
MKIRPFRYATASYRNLLKYNEPHAFAMHHALRLYAANAIYTYIPKNACSTLRLSLAIANGCIRDTADFQWIHHNNTTFCADLASAQTATYTFVVLRCPYARLASAYLDKIVGHYPEAWAFYELAGYQREVSDISFDFFIRQLAEPSIRTANIHWRPQVDFLLYDQYDDYFAVENFSHVVQSLQQKIDLSVVDARHLTQHGTDDFTLLGQVGDYAQQSAFSIRQLKHAGQCPRHAALYTDELIALVKKHYAADIALYESLFGTKGLLFS